MIEAPLDEPAVLVADFDLDQRRDGLTLRRFATRRPEKCGRLVAADGLHD